MILNNFKSSKFSKLRIKTSDERMREASPDIKKSNFFTIKTRKSNELISRSSIKKSLEEAIVTPKIDEPAPSIFYGLLKKEPPQKPENEKRVSVQSSSLNYGIMISQPRTPRQYLDDFCGGRKRLAEEHPKRSPLTKITAKEPLSPESKHEEKIQKANSRGGDRQHCSIFSEDSDEGEEEEEEEEGDCDESEEVKRFDSMFGMDAPNKEENEQEKHSSFQQQYTAELEDSRHKKNRAYTLHMVAIKSDASNLSPTAIKVNTTLGSEKFHNMSKKKKSRIPTREIQTPIQCRDERLLLEGTDPFNISVFSCLIFSTQQNVIEDFKSSNLAIVSQQTNIVKEKIQPSNPSILSMSQLNGHSGSASIFSKGSASKKSKCIKRLLRKDNQFTIKRSNFSIHTLYPFFTLASDYYNNNDEELTKTIIMSNF